MSSRDRFGFRGITVSAPAERQAQALTNRRGLESFKCQLELEILIIIIFMRKYYKCKGESITQPWTV